MTLKEIAEEAGVSIGTVDRVLHRRGRVSLDTRTKVEAIIDRSGFSPNPIASHLKRNRTYRFAVLGPRKDEDSGYWDVAYAGIGDAMDTFSAFDIETELFEFDRYDRDSFAAAAAGAAAGRDGILMAPVMPDAALAYVRTLEGHLPYGFFDALLPGTAPVVSIFQDSYRSGYLAGRLARLLAGGDGIFCAASAHAEDYHISLRRQGFQAYFADHGSSEVVFLDSLAFEDDAAIDGAIRALVGETEKLRGIFVTSASAHRVAAALISSGAKTDVAVVGFDLVKDNAAALLSGGIDAIISQRPRIQVRAGLEAMIRSTVFGDAVAAEQRVPMDVYFKENVDDSGVFDLRPDATGHEPAGANEL